MVVVLLVVSAFKLIPAKDHPAGGSVPQHGCMRRGLAALGSLRLGIPDARRDSLPNQLPLKLTPPLPGCARDVRWQAGHLLNAADAMNQRSAEAIQFPNLSVYSQNLV